MIEDKTAIFRLTAYQLDSTLLPTESSPPSGCQVERFWKGRKSELEVNRLSAQKRFTVRRIAVNRLTVNSKMVHFFYDFHFVQAVAYSVSLFDNKNE
jgi:hypothetical protein